MFDDSQLLTMYNFYSERPVNKFTDRYTAEVRLATLLHTRKLYPWNVKFPTCIDTLGLGVYMYEWRDDPKLVAIEESRMSRIQLGDRIRILVKKNPKLKCSEAWARFNIYKENMVVFDFTEYHKKHGGHHGLNKAWQDIKYDVAHGFIEIIRTDVNGDPVY